MYDDAILNDNYSVDNDEDIVYDEGNEVTVGTILITAAAAVSIIRMLKSLFSGLKRGDIVNVDNMVKNGMNRKDAVAKANKTIKFLESKGYISRELAKSNDGVIRYSDLTDEGKLFCDEYYRTIKSKSTKVDLDKITKSKLVGKTFKNIGELIASILEVSLSVVGVCLIGSPVTTVVGYVILMSGSFNLGYDIGKLISGKYFKDNLPEDTADEDADTYDDDMNMVLESVYEDGYYQALADMGYVVDNDEASEDVDIFNEGYFDMDDEAMEGPAREYRREHNKGRSHDDIRNERRVTGEWENDPNTSEVYNKAQLYGKRHNVSNPEYHAFRESELKSRKGAPNTTMRTKAAQDFANKMINSPDAERRYVLAGNKACRMNQLKNDQKLINASYAKTTGEASRIIHK